MSIERGRVSTEKKITTWSSSKDSFFTQQFRVHAKDTWFSFETSSRCVPHFRGNAGRNDNTKTNTVGRKDSSRRSRPRDYFVYPTTTVAEDLRRRFLSWPTPHSNPNHTHLLLWPLAEHHAERHAGAGHVSNVWRHSYRQHTQNKNKQKHTHREHENFTNASRYTGKDICRAGIRETLATWRRTLEANMTTLP